LLWIYRQIWHRQLLHCRFAVLLLYRASHNASVDSVR
jgi:hypothetical protein